MRSRHLGVRCGLPEPQRASGAGGKGSRTRLPRNYPPEAHPASLLHLAEDPLAGSLPPQQPDPVDLDRLSTYSIAERAHKVKVEQLGQAVEPSASLSAFLDSLPETLAVERLPARPCRPAADPARP